MFWFSVISIQQEFKLLKTQHVSIYFKNLLKIVKNVLQHILEFFQNYILFLTFQVILSLYGLATEMLVIFSYYFVTVVTEMVLIPRNWNC